MAREIRRGREDVVGKGTTKRLRISTDYKGIQRTMMVTVVTMMTIEMKWRRKNRRTRTTT